MITWLTSSQSKRNYFQTGENGNILGFKVFLFLKITNHNGSTLYIHLKIFLKEILFHIVYCFYKLKSSLFFSAMLKRDINTD